MSPTSTIGRVVRFAPLAVLLVTFINLFLVVHYHRTYLPLSLRSEESHETARSMTVKRTTTKNEDLFPGTVMHDDDIAHMINRLNTSEGKNFFPRDFWIMDMFQLTRQQGRSQRQNGSTLSRYRAIPIGNTSMTNWLKFHRNIRQYSLYDPDDPAIDALLHDMAHLPIKETEENNSGTTLKINLRLSDDGLVIIKPMRYERDVEATPNIFIARDFERHVGEIAAFQLDKILGFYRVPPAVGRRISLAELKEIAPKSVKDTFFKSPHGNTCFFGHCKYFCDISHAFCGKPDMIEVAVMSHLPSHIIARLHTTTQPWLTNYSVRTKMRWETKTDFCDTIKKTAPYNNGRVLLDIIDFRTFDFLTGNRDRHSYSTFFEFGKSTSPVLYDNGRGFGRTMYDATSILVPLGQCCLIRKSTFLKYVKLYTGPEPLSILMERALASDPVAPVLTRGHLNALDRRVVKILKEIAICLNKLPVAQVIVNDDF